MSDYPKWAATTDRSLYPEIETNDFTCVEPQTPRAQSYPVPVQSKYHQRGPALLELAPSNSFDRANIYDQVILIHFKSLAKNMLYL